MISRQFLLKSFAALIIIGFLVELLIVYTYTPNAPQSDVPATQAQQEQEYIGTGLVEFTVASFTGSMLFQCNASAVPEFEGILGKPVQVGSGAQGSLFLARQAGNSFTDSAFLSGFAGHLQPICGNVVLFREALVVFNDTRAELAAITDASQLVNLSNTQFSVYRDRFGRGPVALISDASAVSGSVVPLRMRAVLIGTRAIKPGSLLLEQPALPAVREMRALLQARVVVLHEKLAVIQVPWENRTLEFQGDFIRRDEVVIPGNVDVNASFVESVEVRGEETVLHVGNFSDKQIVLGELAAFQGVEFPSSTLFVLYNGTAPQTPFNASLLSRVAVQAINASLDFNLPQEFLALAFQNVSINDEIFINIRAAVRNNTLIELSAVQQGVSNG
ncbi:hypothetical protein HY571_02020 [Candidatus Micrarchaeota archaeon]|nr:hypothetical protein [Candidatus Micrarchaeota archaeon]